MGEVARWTLIAVVVLLAFIGFLHLTRGTAVKHVRGVGADAAPVAVSEPEFALSVAMLTGASLLSGNRVEVALNGDGNVPHVSGRTCDRHGGPSRFSCTTGIRDGWGTR